MGCGGSKLEEFPVVTLCRERKNFLKNASDQRYALAAAHLSYLQSLRDIGEALRRFSDQDLFLPTASTPSSSSSSISSPVLTLPSREGKSSKNSSNHHDDHDDDSHLHLSSGSELSSPSSDHFNHHHEHQTPEAESEPERERDRGFEYGHEPQYEPEPQLEPSSSYGYNYPYPYPYQQDWNQNQNQNQNPNQAGVNSYAYYMKKSAPRGKSVIYQEPERHVAESGQWTGSPYGYGYNGMNGSAGGFFGFPAGPSTPAPPPPAPAPAPPSPPRVSTWDFLNFFESVDNGYSGYGSYGLGLGLASSGSSPDSKEVREREGIPELEDETEQETVKEVRHEKKKKKKVAEEVEKEKEEAVKGGDFGEGTSNSKEVPLQQVSSSEGSSKTVRFHTSEGSGDSISSSEKLSPDNVVPKGSPPRKKGVSFEIEGDEDATVTTVEVDGESSMLSSLSTLSPHGTRDLKEVVREIRDEFETASNHGREVAFLLEVYKPPYQSRLAAFRVIYSRILEMLAPSKPPSHPPSGPPIQFSSRTMKLAKAYCGEPEKELISNPINLSSTLEKLYAWEKKLYKEVKDEERLRAIYEKQCKRLKALDNRGAEATKIDATESLIRKLLTKINICIKSVETISGRIHKLRDEELQPQLAALINGLIRMWKFMFQCHQKQFQAIMESKTQSLKLNTGLQRDEGLKAIIELERELLNWCTQFNNWVRTQKSYVENLNGWLRRCLHDEPEETDDGVVPYSPSRIGAPQAFIICNDWQQAMNRISERGVADAMGEFAQKLHELWERQDEEQRRKIRAEYLTKDFEKQLKALRTEMGASKHEHDNSYFFHYSGHGGQVKDEAGDEEDGYDETIMPVDFMTNGQIIDDELHALMVAPLPKGVRLTVIFDCCHSGTVLDLPYVYSTRGVVKESNILSLGSKSIINAGFSYIKGGVIKSIKEIKNAATEYQKIRRKNIETKGSPADVIMFSGCKDEQTSADAQMAGEQVVTGAMSHALVTSLNKNAHPTYQELLNSIREVLKTKYAQKPQLSASHVMNMSEKFTM